MRLNSTLHTQQRGGALIVALSMLLILTILGMSAMSTSTLQERMSGNARDYEVAFESAETAMRAAEKYIESLTTTSDFGSSGGTGGKYTPRGTYSDAWVTESNWSSAVSVATSVNVARNPQYIVQIVESRLGSAEEINTGAAYGSSNTGATKPTVFQITVRGFGLSPNSRVMLQAYYGRYF